MIPVLYRATKYLAVVSVVLLAYSTLVAQGQNRRVPPPGGGQADFSDKPVEEVRKNIQVLKGMPASQLNTVMNLMSRSLGVECKFCHYADGSGIHFESDSLFSKRTAREMIKLVGDLNDRYFHGRHEVTCFTCHRNSTQPMAVLPLPQVAHDQHEEQEGEEHALPSASDVLARYERAIGSADAIGKIKTRVIKGTSVNARGEANIEIVQKAPDKYAVSVTMNNGNVSSRGFDGTTGWMKNNRGSRILPASEGKGMEREAAMFPIEHLRSMAGAMRIVGVDTADGKASYIVIARPDEHTRERYYIDTASGLLLRRVIMNETVLGFVPEQADYSDYREVDGVKIPFLISTSTIEPEASTVRKITSVEQNVPVDDDKFSLPKGQD